MKLLHLTIKKKWFDLIKSGKKKEEYREIKPYYQQRFFKDDKIKEFDFIIFRNGYGYNNPSIKVEWKGIEFGEFEGKKCFVIKLGKVEELE